ncbi:MAG: ATP-binding cassette domain-containing protein [Gemmatimonadetes bacterium]|nr:ATP-binding cassette domain-containing protein [Gemmatimonadota bacterium]
MSAGHGAGRERAEILRAEGVVKCYGPVVALDHVSVSVFDGECVALVGESGSGKTTLLRCFNRMVEPDEGVIRIDGRDVRELDSIALRRSTGYVQQDGGLLPHWTVLRNAALVPWLHRWDRADALAAEVLDLVGLPPDVFAARWPNELSGGQRQRVALARALAARPRLVLLDEPFGALDAITRSDLQQTFRQLQRELGITTLMVTHDLHEAALLADRIAVVRDGRIEQVADPTALIRAPANDYVDRLLARARLRGP